MFRDNLADSIDARNKLDDCKKVEEVAVVIGPSGRRSKREAVHFYSNAEQKNIVYFIVLSVYLVKMKDIYLAPAFLAGPFVGPFGLDGTGTAGITSAPSSSSSSAGAGADFFCGRTAASSSSSSS